MSADGYGPDGLCGDDFFRGYRTCLPCSVGQHDRCNGEARIHHVGGAVETVACACVCGSTPITPIRSSESGG